MSGESQSNVLELVLAREKVRNALDLATTERLIEALERARGDAGVRAILLRGEGAGFCAGSDVKEMAQASMEDRLRIAERKALLMRRMAEIDIPVVCAVHG
ncbi:MAG: enoyl-CoA hydratase/isomerase family protein, partial [Proteobacteria bacterium]|nr:enoyl-CoA hydratase/isomerase family protein [Pseudomonadota bacterium]